MRRLATAAVVAGRLALAVASAAAADDPAAQLNRLIAEAEAALREGEPQLAESRYRDALVDGWLLLGNLALAEDDLDGAEAAFTRAGAAAVERRRPLLALAGVRLERGDAGHAVELLRTVVALAPADGAARQLLAQALVAGGQVAEAAQELEEAAVRAPDDPELAFSLATAYLRLGRADAAEPHFARLARQRPGAESWVLIGRTYRDFGDHERAREALRQALALDPRARRAHYYLGTVALQQEGPAGLETAIGEFRDELRLVPDEPIALLYLGMALVEARRPAEALAPLVAATAAEVCRRDALYFLGRAHLGLDRPAAAVGALRQALALAPADDTDPRRRAGLHYQLGTALRGAGTEAEAREHFAIAERYSAAGVESARDQMERFLAAEPGREQPAARGAAFPSPGAAALRALGPAARGALRRPVATALARVHLNLGVLQSQTGRFAGAAELLRAAADLDPELPQVQQALGVALFNAGRFADAAEPLERAQAAAPADAALRSMLALAWLNAERYERAAELLRDDPARAGDRALEHAYALALVRSGRAAEAEPVFAALLGRHGDWPELIVLLGQAHAAQGDYPAAERFLRRALELSSTVAEAHSTLAEIALRQGKLPEAEAALRAELAAHPRDERARFLLATVLQLAGRAEEALVELRAVLAGRPDFADARYLLGKTLLTQGDAPAALEQLEAAARLAPRDANVRYQLAQTYQKLGRMDDARRELEAYRGLKQPREEAQ